MLLYDLHMHILFSSFFLPLLMVKGEELKKKTEKEKEQNQRNKAS